jgi:transcriptional regulator with XRE-family HTH domain
LHWTSAGTPRHASPRSPDSPAQKAQGWTLADLSRRLSIWHATLSAIENEKIAIERCALCETERGHTSISLDSLLRNCRNFGKPNDFWRAQRVDGLAITCFVLDGMRRELRRPRPGAGHI